MTINEIKQARGGIAANRLDTKDLMDGLDGTVKRIYALKGLSVEASVQPEVDLTCRELGRRLLESYPTMTLGEVSLALEAGITGEYGKDVRLTIANCLVWLRTYYWSDDRKDAIRELNEEQKRESRASRLLEAQTDADKDKAFRGEIMKQWRFYRENGHLDIRFDGFAGAMYDHLVKIGKLRASEATVQKAKAMSESQTSANAPKTAQIGTLIENAAKESTSLDNGLNCATKRILLTMYFDSLIARGAVLRL